MPRNGSGTYSLPASTFNPAVTATTIESSAWNATAVDLAAALTQSLSKDGQTVPTGNIQLGGFKITNLANGTTSTDAIAYGQAAKLSGGNTLSGDQVINGAVSLSGDLTVTGAVIFTSTSFTTGNLTVTSVASIASLNVTGTTNANILNVASTASLNVLNVSSAASLNTLTVSSTAAIAVLSVGSSIVVGAASGGSKGAGTINAKGIYVDGTQLGTSGVYQVVPAVNGAVGTGGTTIPFDDSPPLNTEGLEVLSATITPSSAAHKLVFNVTLFASSDTNPDNITGALFQDAVASAISAGTVIYTGATRTISFAFNHSMTAGTTSATTFRVRIGCATGNITFNGAGGTRRMGGVMGSSLIITEC